MISSSQLTYSGVLLVVFSQQLCLPIPSVVFLMAAGALAARGEMQASIVIPLAVIGCLAADAIWFWIGRRWGTKALRLLCALTADPRRSFLTAQERFGQYGLRLLLVSRFVPGLDGIVPPLGGAQGASFTSFVVFDSIGGVLWSGFYVGVGYFFSHKLSTATAWAQQFGTALGIVIGAAIGLYIGWRALGIVRMIHRLRKRRVSPRQLEHKLRSDTKVAVLDLLDFEDEDDLKSVGAIPGAFSVDPSRLQNSQQIDVPDDVEVVLYCSSGCDIVGARAAIALKEIGVDKVWVLEGGLKAWRDHGFPTSHALEAAEVVAKRLGVELPPDRVT